MLGPDTAPLMLLSPLWLPLPATLGLLPDPDLRRDLRPGGHHGGAASQCGCGHAGGCGKDSTDILPLKISEILYVLLGFSVNFRSGDWLVLVYLRMVMVMVVY